MAHVELVGAAGLRALLLRQPDVFFGDNGEGGERRELIAPTGWNGKLIHCAK
jgi:hypothetical protein